MKIGFLITARLGSSRLPQKHFCKVEERTMIDILISRIEHEFRDELAEHAQIVIATTLEDENKAFKEVASDAVTVFQGAKNNIPLRHLQAAQHLGLDAIVSIDGDDVLCSVEAMRSVYNGLCKGADAVTTSGLPLGMNAWGYSTVFLQKSLAGYEDGTLETGWGRIFDNAAFKTVTYDVEDFSKVLRFTLDYQEDFDFFAALIKHYGVKAVDTASWNSFVECALVNKFHECNQCRIDEYWENFEKEREAE